MMSSYSITWTLVLAIVLTVAYSHIKSVSSAVRCGLRPGQGRAMDSLIVGGSEAAPHSWPWQAYILVAVGENENQCGGTIIDKRWILTAAHCVDKVKASDIEIMVGSHNVDKERERGRLMISVSKIFEHAEFDKKNGSAMHDVALLYTTEDIPFGRTIAPACLPKEPVKAGTICYVTGYGFTNNKKKRHVSSTLYEASLPINDIKHCAKLQRGLTTIDDSMYCASLPEGGRDACGGDSGGPLACQNGKYWEVQGVVSWGPKICGIVNEPGVYAKVPYYLDWIKRSMDSV